MAKSGGGMAVESAVDAMRQRSSELAAELERIEIALEQLTHYMATPTKAQHARTRRVLNHPLALPLRARRETAGITAAAFAKALGVSHSYVSQVELGTHKASATVIRHWETKLDELINKQNGHTGPEGK